MENQRSIVLGVIVLLVAAFFLGYYHGKTDGWREAIPKIQKLERQRKDLEDKLQNIANPPPVPQPKMNKPGSVKI